MEFSNLYNFHDEISNLPSDKRKPDKDTYNKVFEIFKDKYKQIGTSNSCEVGFIKRYKIDFVILVLFFVVLTLPAIDEKFSKGFLKNTTIKFLLKLFIFILVTVFVDYVN
jgi:hypothetical protein